MPNASQSSTVIARVRLILGGFGAVNASGNELPVTAGAGGNVGGGKTPVNQGRQESRFSYETPIR